MARKVEKAIREQIISTFEEKSDSTCRSLAEQFALCAQTISRILKEAGLKPDAGRAIRGKEAPHLKGFTAWNKGLKKHTDDRVASYAKTKAVKQRQSVSFDGYTKVWADEFKKTVRLHHLVWFQHTGHMPNTKAGEQIHHIDGNKLNNDISNLVLTTTAEHTQIHKQYEEVVFELLRRGIISFKKDLKKLDADNLWKILNELKTCN